MDDYIDIMAARRWDVRDNSSLFSWFDATSLLLGIVL